MNCKSKNSVTKYKMDEKKERAKMKVSHFCERQFYFKRSTINFMVKEYKPLKLIYVKQSRNESQQTTKALI